LLLNERLPHPTRDTPRLWKNRFRSIVQLEKHLHRNGTRIVKIFLHLSNDEQRRRFLERLDEPEKHWKFSSSDIHERAYWPSYMTAYGECLQGTSTHHAPWYVVPADDKENARLIVSRIVVDALDGLEMAYPQQTAKRQREMAAARRELSKEST
ncbi:MAG: polyphosphate kinase 2 family protein, partial [Gemmatimonadota bacterium]|nr:polyphosphate kinase 2 family protein [Gemmatimonadota bacterium]